MYIERKNKELQKQTVDYNSLVFMIFILSTILECSSNLSGGRSRMHFFQQVDKVKGEVDSL